ncbi:hypothetical protein AURDEDRAFT_121987 [Auricularia subglabra TFB-10046 SS5]|nr:hypothetical protein AURDEDRAFT_121987 [Auricularia subglabra TFB-10046 SS5]
MATPDSRSSQPERVCQGKVFAGVAFYVTSTIAPDVAGGLYQVLEANGGESAAIEHATHIISDTDTFDNWRDVGNDVHIVTPSWVDRSMSAGAQQGPHFFSPNPQSLFSGFIACSGDLPDREQAAARHAITSLGGQWREALTDDSTHLFCLTANSDQYKKAIADHVHCQIRILLPQWYDDSLTTRRLISYEQYSFPDPPLLGTGAGLASVRGESMLAGECAQKTILFTTGSLDCPPERDSEAATDVWHGLRVFLSPSLVLSVEQRQAVEAMLRHGGAVIVSADQPGGSDLAAVEMCDVLVTRYRDDAVFAHALQQGKVIGTLQWLFHVDQSGRYSSPTDQLLHFPIPSWPIKGFPEQCISITNHSGLSRDYVTKLIAVTGANFTTTLTRANTQVIASSTQGKKVERARAWGIAVVNHLWLEDCLRHWKFLSPANLKYLWFPRNGDPMANLGECAIGRYTMDMWKEEQTERPGAEKPCRSPSQHSPPNGEVTDRYLNLSGVLPSADDSQSVPAAATAASMQEVDDAKACLFPMIASLPPNVLPIKRRYPKRGVTLKSKANIGTVEDEGGTAGNDLPKQERAQESDQGKSSDEPLAPHLGVSPRSKRVAARGHKRSGTEFNALPVAKRTKTKATQPNAAEPRCNEPVDSDGPESEQVDYDGSERVGIAKPRIIRDPSLARTAPNTATREVFYFATQVTISKDQAKRLVELGAKPAKKPEQVTHLIADQIVRTEKFLTSINYAPTIVNSNWVEESVKKRCLLPEEGYLLDHPAGAQKYGVHLREAVRLAKEHKATLLQGCTFYVTKSAVHDYDLVKAVVHSAGGKITARAPSLRQAQDKNSYVISHVDDRPMWDKLARQGVTIYTSDFLLNGVLRQMLPLNDKSYQLNEDA